MRRRVRTSVQPDRARRLSERSKQFEADRLLCDWIEDARDPDVRRSPQRVRGWMRLRLMLTQRQDRRVPAVGLEASRIVQRNSGVVAEIGARNAVWLIFVVQGSPVARQIALRECRAR